MTVNNRKKRIRLWWLPLACTLLLCSCGKSAYADYYTFKEKSKTVHENGVADKEVLLTVDGYDVPYSELRYYLLSEAQRRGGTDDMSALDAQKWAEQTVVPNLLFSRAVAAIAEEHGVELTKEERKALTESIKQLREENGAEYERLLSEHYMTDRLYEFLALQDQLTGKLLSYYTDEATSPVQASDQVIETCASNGELIHVKHILIRNDAGEDKSENLALAERLLAELKNGADFDALMREYSEDPGLQSEPNGYYIFHGEMSPAFEQAAFALDEGQISGVVPVSADSYDGYHIILRQPIEEAFLSANINTLRSNYMTSCFYRDVEARTGSFHVEYTERFEQLNFTGGF